MRTLTIADVEFYSQIRSQLKVLDKERASKHSPEEIYTFLERHRGFVQEHGTFEKLYEPFISHFDHTLFLISEIEKVLESRFRVKDKKKLVSLRVILKTVKRQMLSIETLILRGLPDTSNVFFRTLKENFQVFVLLATSSELASQFHSMGNSASVKFYFGNIARGKLDARLREIEKKISKAKKTKTGFTTSNLDEKMHSNFINGFESTMSQSMILPHGFTIEEYARESIDSIRYLDFCNNLASHYIHFFFDICIFDLSDDFLLSSRFTEQIVWLASVANAHSLVLEPDEKGLERILERAILE